jgi:hypothetical protein
LTDIGTDISIEDTGKDLNVYKDACFTKEPESKGCSCSCASICSATSADPSNGDEKGDAMGDLNDWVGKWNTPPRETSYEWELTQGLLQVRS